MTVIPSRSPEKSAAYIKDVVNWVAWPVCPLKRFLEDTRGFHSSEFGYILAVEGKLLEVRKGNIFNISEADPVHARYDTVEALVADGWMVD